MDLKASGVVGGFVTGALSVDETGFVCCRQAVSATAGQYRSKIDERVDAFFLRLRNSRVGD